MIEYDLIGWRSCDHNQIKISDKAIIEKFEIKSIRENCHPMISTKIKLKFNAQPPDVSLAYSRVPTAMLQ